MLLYGYWSGGELIVENIHYIETYLNIFQVVYYKVTLWN